MGKKNKHLICLCIERDGFDKESVQAINHAFLGAYTPWRLGDSIEELFVNHPNLKEEYKSINEEIKGILPERFFPEEE